MVNSTQNPGGIHQADFNAFVSAAKYGNKDAGALQIGSDGKIHVANPKTGLAAAVTKIAHTLFSLFGVDLRDKFGVPPNQEREQKAFQAFSNLLKDSGIEGADKILPQGSGQVLTAGVLKNLATDHPEFTVAHNNKQMAPFKLETGAAIPPAVNNILKEAGISGRTEGLNENQAFKVIFMQLLNDAVRSGGDLLSSDQLKSSLVDSLGSHKAIVDKFISDPASAIPIEKTLLTDMPNAVGQLASGVNSADSKTTADSLLSLCAGRKSLADYCQKQGLPPADAQKLFAAGLQHGSVLNCSKGEDSRNAVGLMLKSMATEGHIGNAFREALGAFKAASQNGSIDVGSDKPPVQMNIKAGAGHLQKQDLAVTDFILDIPKAVAKTFPPGFVGFNPLSLSSQVSPDIKPQTSSDPNLVAVRQAVADSINARV